MSTGVLRFGPSLASYQVTRDSLVIDDERDGYSNATFTTVSSGPSHGTTVFVGCNTINSLTFGGVIRSRRIQQATRYTTPRYEYEADDWGPLLDAIHPVQAFNSVAPNTIVATLVENFAAVSSFTTTGVLGGYVGDPITLVCDGRATIRQALNSVVDAVTAANISGGIAWRPRWHVTPNRVMEFGHANSLGTTITVDDSDMDLVTFDAELSVSSIVNRVWIWGGSTTCQYIEAVPSTQFTVAGSDGAWWDDAITYPGLYVGHLKTNSVAELIAVTSVAVSSNIIYINSLNTRGVANAGMYPGDEIRCVYMVESTTLQHQMGSLGCGTGVFDCRMDQSLTATAFGYTYEVQQLFGTNGTAVNYLRLRTMNSQAATSGRVAVSLTVASGYQGVYDIQRVRVVGFNRGDTARAIYEVEAGLQREARISDIL